MVMEKHIAFIWSIIISMLPTNLIILGNSHISTNSIDSSLFSQPFLPIIIIIIKNYVVLLLTLYVSAL